MSLTCGFHVSCVRPWLPTRHHICFPIISPGLSSQAGPSVFLPSLPHPAMICLYPYSPTINTDLVACSQMDHARSCFCLALSCVEGFSQRPLQAGPHPRLAMPLWLSLATPMQNNTGPGGISTGPWSHIQTDSPSPGNTWARGEQMRMISNHHIAEWRIHSTAVSDD